MTRFGNDFVCGPGDLIDGPGYGPWRYSFDADGDHAIFAGNTLIAVTVGEPDVPREVDEDHARLMTSAPQLLKALKAALPNLEWANIHGSRCDEEIAQAKAAIAKAEKQP